MLFYLLRRFAVAGVMLFGLICLTFVIATFRTSRNVRCPVAIRGKADTEQAALSKLDL
jgi:hypothetical protein